jgi:predicted ATP-dependent protease
MTRARVTGPGPAAAEASPATAGPAVELAPADLRLTVDAKALGFDATSELVQRPLPWIGQERAERAARFGLRMDPPGYNLFVLGEVGSGRTTLMHTLMVAEAAGRPVPPDLCYLHDFETPERPTALRLPAGEGRQLRQWMLEFTTRLHSEIPDRLAAADVKAESERIEGAFKTDENAAFEILSTFAHARGFSLVRDEGRMVFTQRDAQGEPLTAGKAMTLTPEQRAALDHAENELRTEISRFLEKMRARAAVMNDGLAALRRKTIAPVLHRLLDEIRGRLRKQIKDAVKLGRFFEQVQAELLDKLVLFQPGDEHEEARIAALDAVLARLRVNVVVDNPLFRSLFGSIEYASENDVLVTDFSRIRAGSLLNAHGGYLLLHLRDLLADAQVWEKLRRFLRSGRLQIEEPGTVFAPIAAVSLQPEPVPVDVKIVLIASVEDYYIVQEGDPEAARHFRCKVDFADRFAATPSTHDATAVFVAHRCREAGLPHFAASAVAALIEQSHRVAQDQRRQSALFGRTEALMLESAALARARGAALVEAVDVGAAIEARIHRHDYPAQRLHDAIADGTRLIDVAGERVGQVNGLTVIDLGDHQFGFPVRVSASTHAGDEGLLNIEREVELSGPIHDKGVLILHRHLSALFAHIAPLALDAALVFEQEYGGIEGDSASCAEFYALLSSLSGLPLKQGIAVTGAINQDGAMLPVGGINEKIEGFFRSCERLGLDGQQGVLIPWRNRRHLMLSPPVVQAVEQGRFHIHAVDRADDGLALLTGVALGTLGSRGYPAGTVLGRAQRSLQAFRRACDAAEDRRSAGKRRRPGARDRGGRSR